MSLTRDGRHAEEGGGSTHAATTEPGKHSRAGALPVQRKAAPSAAPPGVASAAGPARAAGDDPFGLHLPVQRTPAASGVIQLKAAHEQPHEQAHAQVHEHGPDTFGLGGYLEKLKAKTGVSAEMGKYAEAKLGVTTPPIPQLGGGKLKIEGEGRYLNGKGENELEVGLHLGVTWGVDLKLFKADVQVFGEGKIKLKAKDGEMLACLGAAVKGVLYDALRTMTVKNVATLASPMAAHAAEWALGNHFMELDVFKALGMLASSHSWKVPHKVKDAAKDTLAALEKFFGKHEGSYEVSMAIGVSGDVGGGGEHGVEGGVAGKAVHGIAGEDGGKISDEKRRNELAIEAHLKKGETEGKVGFVFGGGRNILSLEASFLAENHFDFDKAKLLSIGAIMKLFSAAGLGASIGHAHNAPNGSAMVNAIVGGLASGAGVIGNHNLPGLKKQYKVSLEVEREGDHPWKDAKVDCKLFLGNAVGGKHEGGNVGEVEASAAAGTYVSIGREVKEHLPGHH